MRLEFEEFKYSMLDLCDVKGWRVPRDSALEAIYEQFPTDPATKEPYIDAEDFEQATKEAMQSEYRGDPGSILKTYKTVRLHKAKAVIDAQPLLRPAKHEGRPCEEFVRVCRQMRAMREGTLPKFRQQCSHQPHGIPACQGTGQHSHGKYEPCKCLAEWNARPLTDEDWRRGSKTEPAAAVAAGFGFDSVKPDPKERDVVYGGV